MAARAAIVGRRRVKIVMHIVPVFMAAVLINAASYFIGLAYVFSGDGDRPGFLLSIAGPIATVVAWPVVWIQNAVPLGRPADTIVGIGVASILEAIIIATAIRAIWPPPKPGDK